MATDPLVPEDFDPPTRLVADRFWLEPLGPHHAVTTWLEESWPWQRVDRPGR